MSSPMETPTEVPDTPPQEVAGGLAVRCSIPNPRGDGRNEDAAAVFAGDTSRGVLIVADGFGGQPAGGQASGLAVAALIETVGRALETGSELREGILNGFELANQRVTELGVGAATTLAAVEIEGGGIRPYHAGDSEILVVGQRGKIKLQTIAHSPVGFAVEAGLIEENEALHHEDRHLVSNMVGSAEMRIEIGPALPLGRLDTVLVASDGLFDNLHQHEIVDRVRTGPITTVRRRLVDQALRRMQEPAEGLPSKPDDLTFIVFRLARADRAGGREQSAGPA